MSVTRVDEVKWEYTCQFGYGEFVKVVDNLNCVVISSEDAAQDGDYVVQKDDIPNMIVALQAAYDFLNEEK